MKVPLSWLREFIALDLPVAELLEVMGRFGLEIDEVRTPGAGTHGVSVARVLDVRDHPDADKLIVVTVDDGDGERVVCAGARNIAVGDLVPLAPPGATLPGGVTIGRREMRGIVSDGMLCSARELQLVDDHGGIMVLDVAAAPGRDLIELIPLGEPVIEVAVPADRGDLHSVVGIARDLAAILEVELHERPAPADTVVTPRGDVAVSVAADDGCPRYVGWVVRDVTVGPAPWEMRRRLEACGVRSISNIVDVTNYVMLELGQPLHAFDVAALRGAVIDVRWARDGERLTTLDGRERTLRADDLVIADGDGPVALAGVMGGALTEVGPATTDVLLEAAVFDPAAVRRTSRRLGLVSEASTRFERRVDPGMTAAAAARAVELLGHVGGARDAGAEVAGPGPVAPTAITFDPDWCARFLGVTTLTADDQAALLARAGVAAHHDGDRIEATPPTWRGDLARPADLAEEIARLHGYERIPSTLPAVALRGGLTPRQRARREVRATVRAFGLSEVHTYPFVGAARSVLLEPDDPGRVVLQNPLAKDAGTMRPTLVDSLLEVARRNVGQGRAGLGLFEVARIFRPAGGPLDAVLDASAGDAWRWLRRDGDPLPTQPLTFGMAAYGRRLGPGWLDPNASWELADLVAVVDEVVRRLVPDETRLVRVATERAGLHAGRTLSLRWDDHEIGVLGQLDPRVAADLHLPEPVVVGEVLLDVLWGHMHDDDPFAHVRQATPLARHPAVTVDVAVVTDDAVPYAEVAAAVRDGAGELLDALWWFDEYRGDQVGEGRRSLAFRLRLQSPERQLTDTDAEAVIEGVELAVTAIGGTLRR